VLMTFRFSPINNMGTLPLFLVYSETKVSLLFVDPAELAGPRHGKLPKRVSAYFAISFRNFGIREASLGPIRTSQSGSSSSISPLMEAA